MSGMEKFQASEAWRTNFKKFLFMERKPEVVQKTLTLTESQRYSLDITEDLKNIIEQKKTQKSVQINPKKEIINISNNNTEKDQQENMNGYDDTNGELPMWQITSEETFEALEMMCEKTVSDPNSTLFKYLNGEEEEQKSNKVLAWQKTSDESFEALEKMCDKTASDSNSTLFQYLHSDRREKVLAEVKKRNAYTNNLNTQILDDNLRMQLNNCTLLDDIEEPSRMWENSVCSDTILQTSPVKMVGLLRPSTIIEEATNDSENSDISSQTSFHTATKGAQSDVSASAYETAYETAHDSTAASNLIGVSNKYGSNELEDIDIDHILLKMIAKNEQTKADAAAIIPSLKITEATMIEPEPLNNRNDEENYSNTCDLSVDLIDLEKTFGPLHNSPHSSILENEEPPKIENNTSKIEDKLKVKVDSYIALDDSIIEILSDDELDDVNKDKPNINDISFKKEQTQTFSDIEKEVNMKTDSLSINNDTYSFNESCEIDKENRGETRELSEKSMQFNDTMEEVEYMLKKGMEYLAAEADVKKITEIKKAAVPACNIQVLKPHLNNSPMKHRNPVTHVSSSVSKAKTTTNTTPFKKTSVFKGTSSNSKRYDIDFRPFPKLDIFAKPPVHARNKELASKMQKFSHVVSPIGTYMKKTAKTPLMSSMNCKNNDYFNSTAIIELKNESRLYQPHFATDANESGATGQPKLPGLLSGSKRPLPKKAYISSDLKHIVDDRTPVTIPGGKKIQKYLENALMPAVLRHEGKFKMPASNSNKLNFSASNLSVASSELPLKVSDTNLAGTQKSSNSHVLRRNNSSLADLSLMSGDVSMYTIMDAQKF